MPRFSLIAALAAASVLGCGQTSPPVHDSVRAARLGAAVLRVGFSYGLRPDALVGERGGLSAPDLADAAGRPFTIRGLPENEAGRRGYDFEVVGCGPDGTMGTGDDVVWHPQARPTSSMPAVQDPVEEKDEE